MQNKTVNNYINKLNLTQGMESLVGKYPSFELDLPTLKATMKEVASEKLRVAMDSNKYGTLTGLKIGYDELVHVQRLENAGINMSEKQEKMLAFMKDVLPMKMERDPNMSANELLRGTVAKAISERVHDGLMELQFLGALHEAAPHPSTTIELREKKENLVGTLLLVNHKYPMVGVQLESSLSELAFSEGYAKIQDDLKNPSMAIKKKVLEADPYVASKLFPLELDQLKSTKTNRSAPIPS